MKKALLDFKKLTLVLVVLISGNLLCLFMVPHAFAEVAPQGPIKIYSSLGTPPPEFYSWRYEASDSVEDFKRAVQDLPDWMTLVDSPNEADLNVIIMGRKYFSKFGYKSMCMVWIVIQRGSENFSLMGTAEHLWRGATVNAAISLQQWIKNNYELLLQKQWIPGGLNQPSFMMQVNEQDLVQSRPTGPRLKVYCDVGDTPELYRRSWGVGKSDSVKDIKEKIRKKSKWLELTEQKQNADFVLEVMGRQWSFDNHVLWTQIVLGGEKIPFVLPLLRSTWKDTAEDLVNRLDLWADKSHGDIKFVSAAIASGAKNPEMDVSSVSQNPAENKPATISRFAVVDAMRIVKESEIGQSKWKELRAFRDQLLKELKEKRATSDEISKGEKEIQRRLDHVLHEIEQQAMPIVQRIAVERRYDFIVETKKLEELRNQNSSTVIINKKDTVYFASNSNLTTDISSQNFDDITEEVIRQLDLAK